MPVAPLPFLDDRGERRVFCMLSLLAAHGPVPRRELLERVEHLVSTTAEEQQTAPNAPEHTHAAQTITRSYEALRRRGLLVDPPLGGRWALTELGREHVAEAAGSYLDFWGR
ncbi:hypothetical protein [Kineococcus sp. SYSU DK002]|uniref:hypothetical protein n=1 Tax=Kineococcus sp. SYSU DK002 TaxID=3383123 RepID=UPI003D7DD455